MFTFWIPREKGPEVYSKFGDGHLIKMLTKKGEKITNGNDGLDVKHFYQIMQKEPQKRVEIDESLRLHKQVMICAFDEDGNYDATLDSSVLVDDEETKSEKKGKDGFREYINTVIYLLGNANEGKK